jgi:acetyl esterase/lipase
MKLLAALLVLVSIPSLAQQRTLLLWPNGNPEPTKITGPEIDPTTDKTRMLYGKPTTRITNVSQPSLTVYPAASPNGAAVLVLPGGGYGHLSWQHEGQEVCQWLNSLGVTGILVKYRVPEKGHYPENVEDLEDAQQAMRLTHQHDAEWKIDPAKIGVIGFSAGAHLAVVLSTHPDDHTNPNAPAPTGVERPAFQMVIYPAYTTAPGGAVAESVKPSADVPPTFLVQAENDYTAKVESSVFYFLALKDAKVPAEMHLFTQGGHGFALRATSLPVGAWPSLAETWLHSIHMLGPAGAVARP